jgi:A/G-specific adenine glycosylase
MGSQGRESNRCRLLSEWFSVNGRDLPWRRSRDPWLILVSELMLQQTQVTRVVERLPGFMRLFPTPGALAAAQPAEVITAWSGLGYNRRAVNLRRSAVQIVSLHDGEVPEELDSLLALPGVGPYTARAVRVFAFERADAVVDTNVGRVLARWEGRSLTSREVQSAADELVDREDPWTWNQALVELGALVCSKVPRCGLCNVSGECSWFASGKPDPDPALGSAAVSQPQKRFEGSDRQGRAALVRTLTNSTIGPEDLAQVMGWPNDEDRAVRVAQTLVADGLVDRTPNGCYRLPS